MLRSLQLLPSRKNAVSSAKRTVHSGGRILVIYEERDKGATKNRALRDTRGCRAGALCLSVPLSKDTNWSWKMAGTEVARAHQLDVDEDEELPLLVLGASRTTPIQVDVSLNGVSVTMEVDTELPCQ